MAVTLHNGDRFRALALEGGGVRLERARRCKPAGWARAAVSVMPSTLETAKWTRLGVLRWYRWVLKEALAFGVPNHTIEVEKPSVVPLGVPVTVSHMVPVTPKKSRR